MTDHTEYVISPWEIEACIQSLQASILENIGTKRYLSLYISLELILYNLFLSSTIYKYSVYLRINKKKM